jgi:hypothetical protein
MFLPLRAGLSGWLNFVGDDMRDSIGISRSCMTVAGRSWTSWSGTVSRTPVTTPVRTPLVFGHGNTTPLTVVGGVLTVVKNENTPSYTSFLIL